MAKNKLVGTPNPPPSQQSPGPQFIGRDPCEYSAVHLSVPAPVPLRSEPALLWRREASGPERRGRRSLGTPFVLFTVVNGAFEVAPRRFVRIWLFQLSPIHQAPLIDQCVQRGAVGRRRGAPGVSGSTSSPVVKHFSE